MKPNKNYKSTPDNALEECIYIQQRLDDGENLQAILQKNQYSGIVHNTIYTLIRNQATIDWLISNASQKRVRPRLRKIMRWAVTQFIYLQGVPTPLVVDCCVRLTKKRYKKYEAGFVNALLRELGEKTVSELLTSVTNNAPKEVYLNLPLQLYQVWEKRFDEKQLQDLAKLLLEPAPLTLRLRKDAPIPTLDYLKKLPKQSWFAEYNIYQCSDAKALFNSEQFLRGDFYIQDPSTLLAPHLLQPAQGERIADLCAAPGGKALCILEQLNSKGELVCMDKSAKRLQRVKNNLIQHNNYHCVVGSATEPHPELGAFDAILLDVPCSNTGVIKRRPDVRQKFSIDGMKELINIQKQILQQSAKMVIQNGRIVYSTCSIEPEENSLQIKQFLANNPNFQLQKEQQLMPNREHDGAYAALLKKTES